MKLMQVPRLNDRLDIVIWATEFPLRYEELAPIVNKCYDLFYQLLQSGRFEKVCAMCGGHVYLSASRCGAGRGGVQDVEISVC